MRLSPTVRPLQAGDPGKRGGVLGRSLWPENQRANGVNGSVRAGEGDKMFLLHSEAGKKGGMNSLAFKKH